VGGHLRPQHAWTRRARPLGCGLHRTGSVRVRTRDLDLANLPDHVQRAALRGRGHDPIAASELGEIVERSAEHRAPADHDAVARLAHAGGAWRVTRTLAGLVGADVL